MLPEQPPSEAAQVLPPPKQFLSQDQFDELWNARGMKFAFDTFHLSLLSRGLAPYVNRPSFRASIYGLLQNFLVNGDARRDPKQSPIPRFPKVV